MGMWRVAGAAVLLAAQIATAQSPTTQPTNAAAVVYIVPEPTVSTGRLPYAYGSQVITPVPPEQVGQQYSCVIRLDSDSDVGNPMFNSSADSQSAVALLSSTALIDPAAKQALGLSSQQCRELVVVNVFPAGNRLARVEVILRKLEGKTYPQDGAAKLADELINRLRVAYAASSEAAHKAAAVRRDPLTQQLAEAQARLDALHQQEQQTRMKAALANVNPQMDIPGQMGNLQMQRRNLEGDLSRNRARLKSLETGSAPLVAQWSEIVSVRQKRLDELKKSAADHQTTDQQVQEAAADLAEAKAQLEQAKNLPEEQSPVVNRRNNEAANLRAMVAEQEDRMKQFDDQLARLQDPQFQALLQQFPDIQGKQMTLRNQISEIQGRLDQIRRSSHGDGTVTITVLDGTAR